jgi:hypothetical protein
MLAMIMSLVGCSSRVAFNIKDNEMKNLSPLTVARHKVLSVKKITGGGIAAILLTGGFGANAYFESGGRSMVEKYNLQDPGQIITSKFLEFAPKEIHNWPTMNIIDNTIDDEYLYKGALLEIIPELMSFGSSGEGKGLYLITIARMRDEKRNIIWEDKYIYRSIDYGRDKDLEVMEADEGKLIKEEMLFGAEISAKKFIMSLKGEKI